MRRFLPLTSTSCLVVLSVCLWPVAAGAAASDALVQKADCSPRTKQEIPYLCNIDEADARLSECSRRPSEEAKKECLARVGDWATHKSKELEGKILCDELVWTWLDKHPDAKSLIWVDKASGGPTTWSDEARSESQIEANIKTLNALARGFQDLDCAALRHAELAAEVMKALKKLGGLDGFSPDSPMPWEDMEKEKRFYEVQQRPGTLIFAPSAMSSISPDVGDAMDQLIVDDERGARGAGVGVAYPDSGGVRLYDTRTYPYAAGPLMQSFLDSTATLLEQKGGLYGKSARVNTRFSMDRETLRPVLKRIYKEIGFVCGSVVGDCGYSGGMSDAPEPALTYIDRSLATAVFEYTFEIYSAYFSLLAELEGRPLRITELKKGFLDRVDTNAVRNAAGRVARGNDGIASMARTAGGRDLMFDNEDGKYRLLKDRPSTSVFDEDARVDPSLGAGPSTARSLAPASEPGLSGAPEAARAWRQNMLEAQRRTLPTAAEATQGCSGPMDPRLGTRDDGTGSAAAAAAAAARARQRGTNY